MDTSPEAKQEIKLENDHYKIKYEAEFQLYLKHINLGKHMHSYFGNAQQVYSIE